MNLSSTFSLSDDVISREVGSETMLLDLGSGTYFGLNAVGGRFWQLLESGKAASEARDILLEEFAVESAILDKDLNDLLEQLTEKKLVLPA